MSEGAPAVAATPAEALALMDESWPRWTAFLDAEQAAVRAEARGEDGWTLAEAVAHVAANTAEHYAEHMDWHAAGASPTDAR